MLASIASGRAPGQTLIGFAAEHGADAIERARAKLERKNVDAIVFNDVSRQEIGFDSSENEVTIVERDGEHPVPMGSKDAIADEICERIAEIRAAASENAAEPDARTRAARGD